MYRQQCPHLQAFTAVVPTWAAGAAPLVKAAVTVEGSQLFLIYTSTEDFPTEVEEKDEGYFAGGQENQFMEPTASEDCCPQEGQCVYALFN